MTVHNEAVLGNEKNFTIFQFGRHIIRFRAPYSLERYTKVKEWNKGYLVVMAKYAHNDKEEEYIDLVPILENFSNASCNICEKFTFFPRQQRLTMPGELQYGLLNDLLVPYELRAYIRRHVQHACPLPVF